MDFNLEDFNFSSRLQNVSRYLNPRERCLSFEVSSSLEYFLEIFYLRGEKINFGNIIRGRKSEIFLVVYPRDTQFRGLNCFLEIGIKVG